MVLLGEIGKYVRQNKSIVNRVGGLIGNLGLFPFMYRGIIDRSSNFNSLPYDGWYKMEGCGISLNGPGIEWGVLVNITTNGHYKFQIATNNNNTIRIRLGDSNFREWKTIYLT